MKRIVYQIDAFTRNRFSGNPAGVVMNAEGMTDAQMQHLARELNNSETAFIHTTPDDASDATIRYFTPTAEVPVCGHATIACGYAIWKEGIGYDNPIRIRTGAGIMAISILPSTVGCRISMEQGEISLSSPFNAGVTHRLLKALGLKEDEIDPRCPVQIASTGHSKVMIGIRRKETVDSLRPDMAALEEISREIACNGFYAFSFDSGEKDTLVTGRMFAPAIGINEDPVTGNANGPLGAYIVANGLAESGEDGQFCFRAKQGEAIGRTGHVDVKVDISPGGIPTRVTISGEAIDVFRTEIDI